MAVRGFGAARARGVQAPRRRFFGAQLAVTGMFLILLGRLWQLQVHSGELYFRKSADNFVKEVELPASRGQIRDARGRVLAENRPAYHVYVIPRLFTDEALQRVAGYLRLDDEAVDALREKVAARRGLERQRQLLAFEEIDRDQLALLESQRLELPGVAVEAASRRQYPYGPLAGHALGHMNQITAEELAERRDRGYRAGDFIGRAGLERQWESFLHGKDGVERIVVDAKGQRKQDDGLLALSGGLRREEPIPGNHLVITLDLALQQATERALRRHPSAAAMVLEVETGRVLAMSSWPEVDPNRLSGRLSRGELEGLLEDPSRPMSDKVLHETYFPGSTFKVVPLLAGLAEQLIDPSERVICRGAIQFGKRQFHCVEAHGPVDLHQSLSQSCNIYYWSLADRLGLDRMARAAQDLGLGAPTGLGLNGEAAGLIPTMDYYKKEGGFQKGMALNTAIGQGSVRVTVAQLAAAYAALANGGRLYVPQLVDRIETPDGQLVQAFPPHLRRQLSSTPADLRRIRAALYDAVNDVKGTSYAARVPGLSVAGKTGTAQVGNKRVKGGEGSPEGDHAWFASFAPYEKPEIAVVVLVEHGGFGAKAATPVAMEIYKSYFARGAAPEPRPVREPVAGPAGPAPGGVR